MPVMIKVWACTRNAAYTERNCPGYRNLDARQQYYIEAVNFRAAFRVMARKFPEDVGKGFGFSVRFHEEVPNYDSCS